MNLKPIDQQVVVIFGASNGIGRETALQFAQRGAKSIVAARSDRCVRSSCTNTFSDTHPQR
ncbi:SDR family NAD(P)-dependent oxidoreductase [Oculatella sp. FACHB-28]|nr:SDR family NAD(P)-dependent oxidoreductase [Oculatella sp. FACHB-28]MBD2059690.1 SDR family NAD(P)-dependent oxidoreductase [Oculatella sp. FACHB-28]